MPPRADSLLVSLNELRQIENKRQANQQEEERQRELERVRAEHAAERAAREAEARVREAAEAQQRQELERRQREAREAELRLAEAERRARVEAEMLLARQRIELELAAAPRPARRAWIVPAAIGVVAALVLVWLGHSLYAEQTRRAEAEDRLLTLTRASTRALAAAEERLRDRSEALDEATRERDQLRTRACSAPGDPPPAQPAHPGKPGRPKPPPVPPKIHLCQDTSDPLCGLPESKTR